MFMKKICGWTSDLLIFSIRHGGPAERWGTCQHSDPERWERYRKNRTWSTGWGEVSGGHLPVGWCCDVLETAGWLSGIETEGESWRARINQQLLTIRDMLCIQLDLDRISLAYGWLFTPASSIISSGLLWSAEPVRKHRAHRPRSSTIWRFCSKSHWSYITLSPSLCLSLSSI